MKKLILILLVITSMYAKQQSKVSSEFIKPLGGKEIVIIDRDNCPYCKEFKEDVSSLYKGDIPLRTAHKEKLEGFDIKTNLYATPTILFINNGKEVAGYIGDLGEKEFYKVLGKFKFGENSEAYKVAFTNKSDKKYTKRYKRFKNVSNGVFVDKLSGDVLFNTKDRVNSNSGWLNFYKAVDNSTIQKKSKQSKYKIEVIAKRSGIHLGYILKSKAKNKQIFSINASVLDFIPRG
ncbi:MAG: peptide methionine sulfoxide reductase, partial [Epsilonproteobacteria bacterium]|nr:peptide methionine sulfoxide reductase [Campylobacterota bacterium]